MKRYYNPTTKEWYTEGTSLTKNIPNGVFSGIPSVEQLTEWGFEEWVEPTPTPEELLARAKASKRFIESKFYVVDSLVDSYKAADNWKNKTILSIHQLPTDYPDCPWLDDLREKGFIPTT